jgi:hypothetical protein
METMFPSRVLFCVFTSSQLILEKDWHAWLAESKAERIFPPTQTSNLPSTPEEKTIAIDKQTAQTALTCTLNQMLIADTMPIGKSRSRTMTVFSMAARGLSRALDQTK